MTNAERFQLEYDVELWKDMIKSPAQYGLALKTETIPDVARETAVKMVAAMLAGRLVNVSNAMRRAARKLGVAQTVAAIHAFVRS